MIRQKYVVGFLFNEDCTRVALIRKNRPKWQSGRLNGIGGHVEDDENVRHAMNREFFEETGCNKALAWQHMAHMTFPEASIDFFRAFAPNSVLYSLESTTDEQVFVVGWPATYLPAPLIPNLTWLIPLAAYTDDYYEPIPVRAEVARSFA